MEARSTAPNQTPQERYSAQLPARRAACRTFGDRNLAKITTSIRKIRTYRIPLTNILHLCCETELTSFALIRLPSSSSPVGLFAFVPDFHWSRKHHRFCSLLREFLRRGALLLARTAAPTRKL